MKNSEKMSKKPNKRGRPRLSMPKRINATPDQIVEAILSAPPKKSHEWQYLKKDKNK